MPQSFENYLQEVAGTPEEEFDAALNVESAPPEEMMDPNYAVNNEMLIQAMDEVMGDTPSNVTYPDIYDKQILALIDAVTLG